VCLHQEPERLPGHRHYISHLLTPLQLLIIPTQHHPQARRRQHRHHRRRAINPKRNLIPRSHPILIHITRKDTRTITDRINQRQSRRPLTRRPQQRVTNPCQHDDEGRVEGGWHEHNGDVAGRGAGCGGGKDEGEDGDEEGESDVQEAFAGAVGVPGVEGRGEAGEEVGRGREEKGVDVVVAEGFDLERLVWDV